MKIDKWNDFLSKWARAVAAYGTPADFVVGAQALEQEWEIPGWAGSPLEVRLLYSPNNALRRELMEKQKAEAEARKKAGVSARWPNDGNSLCFLCDNVGQAHAASQNPEVPNNAISDDGTYLILPNKYPAFIGHSLFVPKSHDDDTNRITPRTIEVDGKKRMVYIPEPGKTAGDMMGPDYLDALVKACDKFCLVGLNNHVRDGMSIPGHKHFHLYPEDLNLFERAPMNWTVSDEDWTEDTDYGKCIKRVSNVSPFSTLVVMTDRYGDKGIETAAKVLRKMEQAHEVFTLAYNRGILLVSPRKNIPAGERIQIGSGVPLHFFGSDDGMGEMVGKYVPVKSDNYDWGRFMS